MIRFSLPHVTLFAALLVVVAAGMPVGVAEGGKIVHVKVLVDEEEPRNDVVWRQLLVRRVDRASAILSQYCELRFSVTCFGRWKSDDRTTEFTKSLTEFEKEVDAEPAQLAIGFSSQYAFGRGRTSLGGTRGPLNSHILVRDGSPSIQETERLEVLVHELCHYLGAAHSPRGDSVMRPVLGDGRSRARAFQITLDPTNAEIIRLVSNEILDFRVQHMHQLSIPTKLNLRKRYLDLARANPRDPVAPRYALLMDKSIRLAIAQAQRRESGVTTNPTPRQDFVPNASGPPR